MDPYTPATPDDPAAAAEFMAAVPPPSALEPKRPTLRVLLASWLRIGFQSFGGGTSTLALIQQEAVERRQWLTPAEFARDNALCQLAPGINILGLTILIGRKTAGAAGVALALLGLLLPSLAITVGMTALYVRVEALPSVRPAVEAALRGVVPALAGIGFVTAYGIARPLVIESRCEGRAPLAVAIAVVAGSAAVFAVARPPVALILLAGGAVGAIARRVGPGRREP